MRRVLVPAALAALALVLWVAAPALSVKPFMPRAVDFEMALPVGGPVAARGAAAAEGPLITPVQRAPHRFDLVGFRWRSRAGATVRLRVRRDGRWSRWVTAAGAEETTALHETDPVWAGGADAFQLRLSRPLRGLRAHFVNTTGTATGVDRVRTAIQGAAHAAVLALAPSAARAQTAGGAPPIVPRAQWGADQCPPRVQPSFGEVQLAFVHHTVSANDYGPNDSAAMVLAICRYHRNSNGWNDIGYNFLVDKYGRIFEGRAGGIDAPVIGAQAQGYNSESTGIANLGTYSAAPASDAAMQAMAHLIAWKLPLHGVPVAGPVTVSSHGGSDNRYPAGTPVTLQRISGHRDGDSTECPGDALYAQLPALRDATVAAAAAAPAAGPLLSLIPATAELSYPATVQLSGRLAMPDGSALAGAPIQLQLLDTSGYETVASAVTGADGSFSAQVPTTVSRVFRALYAGDPQHGPATSPPARVTVAAVLRARAAARRVRAGSAALLTGSVRPRKATLRLTVERQLRAARYAPSAKRSVKLRAGRFRVRVRLPRAGLYRLRVTFAGDRLNAAAKSAAVFVRAVR
jgi:hypothetical protein